MAVYTDVSDTELKRFLADYDLGDLHAFKGIAEGVENSNFLLATDEGNFILTLYEKRVEASDLPFFIGLMDHLAARGISCPLPVRARDGEALRRLCGRPAAVVTFLEGMWVRRPTRRHCAQLGSALADLHRAAADFPLERRNSLDVASWRELFAPVADRADEIEPGTRSLVETELDAVERDWPRDLPRGVIHADLFPDNVFFFKENLSGLIDFYFACNDLLAYDLGICLNAWCFESDMSFNVTKAKAMTDAYRTVRPFGEGEAEALPILARGAALRFLLTRLVDWFEVPAGAVVVPKDPRDYVRRLRFHARANRPADYGLDL